MLLRMKATVIICLGLLVLSQVCSAKYETSPKLTKEEEHYQDVDNDEAETLQGNDDDGQQKMCMEMMTMRCC